MKLWDHPMSENDFRQCLRIATGATIGFTLCKLFGWNYGVFFHRNTHAFARYGTGSELACIKTVNLLRCCLWARGWHSGGLVW